MAKMDNPEPVNLARAIFLCNVFTFFFAASKACLFPFLTIFLKKLGMSATYTGVIIGCKTLTGFVFAPLWAKCAVRCGRQRCMLMFSLFMMALTYLSLTAIPSMNNAFTLDCSEVYTKVNFSGQSSRLGTSGKPDLSSTPFTSTVVPGIANVSTSLPEVNGTKATTVNAQNKSVTTKAPEINKVPPQTTKAFVKTTHAPAKVTKAPTRKTTKQTKHKKPKAPQAQNTQSNDKELHRVLVELLSKARVGSLPSKAELESKHNNELLEYVSDMLQQPQGVAAIETALEELPDDVANELLRLINPGRKKRDAIEKDLQHLLEERFLHKIWKREQEEETNNNNTKNNEDVETESSWSSLKRKLYDKVKKIMNDVTETEKKMFTVVLVVLMVGEVFCSPVEKVADDSWYEFLESIDDLEKYGMHRVWSSAAFILVPIIVTLIVDKTTCLFGLSLHSFMLHFYLFGAFLGIAFLLAFFYPMSTGEKYKYASKVGKGLRTVCCSNRGLLYTITLLIMGMIFASYYNFLFWMLVDMGSKEITLGLCLTISALSEIPMLLFNDRLVKKLGNGGVVALSVFLLSGRVLYYSFLPTPWAVLPAELLHAFTHTATWWAVLSSPSFNVSPTLSRSIRSIFSSIYFGIGFAIGSIVSGLIYENFGAAILFQAGAVMAIAWFPVLLCGVKCCWESDKTEVKYTKLLTSDNDSSDMEDDWLEQALQNK